MFTPEAWVDLAWSLAAQGAHNLQLISPTGHAPALAVCLAALKDQGFALPVVYKSSGYDALATLRSLEGLIDIYLPDLKFGPGSEIAKRAGADDYFERACEGILEMWRQVGPLHLGDHGLASSGLLVRHLIRGLPEEEEKRIRSFMEGLEGAGVSYVDGFISFG